MQLFHMLNNRIHQHRVCKYHAPNCKKRAENHLVQTRVSIIDVSQGKKRAEEETSDQGGNLDDQLAAGVRL